LWVTGLLWVHVVQHASIGLAATSYRSICETWACCALVFLCVLVWFDMQALGSCASMSFDMAAFGHRHLREVSFSGGGAASGSFEDWGIVVSWRGHVEYGVGPWIVSGSVGEMGSWKDGKGDVRFCLTLTPPRSSLHVLPRLLHVIRHGVYLSSSLRSALSCGVVQIYVASGGPTPTT